MTEACADSVFVMTLTARRGRRRFCTITLKTAKISYNIQKWHLSKDKLRYETQIFGLGFSVGLDKSGTSGCGMQCIMGIPTQKSR